MNYNVKKFGEPTWQWLVEAVRDPAGGANMSLARDIARRHKARGIQIPSSPQESKCGLYFLLSLQ